jgi:hypothetical protein
MQPVQGIKRSIRDLESESIEPKRKREDPLIEQFNTLIEGIKKQSLIQLQTALSSQLGELKLQINGLNEPLKQHANDLFSALARKCYNSFCKALYDLNSCSTGGKELVQHKIHQITLYWTTSIRHSFYHSRVPSLLNPRHLPVRYNTLKETFPSLANILQDPEIKKLATLWCRASILANRCSLPRMSNHSHTLFSLHRPQHPPITFLRIRSPDDYPLHPTQISPQYLSLMEEYKSNGWRHLDVCLLRILDHEEECTIAKARFQLQHDYPQTLTTLCADIHSPYFTQYGTESMHAYPAERLLQRSFTHIFTPLFSSYQLPPRLIDNKEAEQTIRDLLIHLHEDVFHKKSFLPTKKGLIFVCWP